MVFMHREKKEGHEFESLRIRPCVGRAMRVIQIPLNKPTRLFVDSEHIEMENDEEILRIKKQAGLYDEGIVITGD